MHGLNADCLSTRLPPTSPNELRSSPGTSMTPESESGPIHRRRRSSNGKRTCTSCNMTFYRQAEYDRHMKTATVHQQERQFKCQYCGDEFSQADATVQHEKVCLSYPDSDGSQKSKGNETHREQTPENETRALASLGIQCALSIAEVAAEVAPVPYIGPLVGCLTAVFQAVERSKVNK